MPRNDAMPSRAYISVIACVEDQSSRAEDADDCIISFPGMVVERWIPLKNSPVREGHEACKLTAHWMITCASQRAIQDPGCGRTPCTNRDRKEQKLRPRNYVSSMQARPPYVSSQVCVSISLTPAPGAVGDGELRHWSMASGASRSPQARSRTGTPGSVSDRTGATATGEGISRSRRKRM